MPAGNVAGASAAANQITYTRNLAEQPLTVTDATGGTTTFAYDADGNLVSTKDADGNLTTVQLDLVGRTIQQTNPDGGIDKWAYTGEGRPVTHTDPAGTVTVRHAYDAMGREVSQTDAYGKVTTTLWNDALPTQTVTAPDGTKVRTAFDRLDRIQSLTPIDTINGSTPATTYEYDNDGNLTKTANGTSTSLLAYDALGRLRYHDENAQDARMRPGRTSFYYDAVGNLTRLDYPTAIQLPDTATGSATTGGAASVDYTYDSDDEMVSATDAASRRFSFTYDANGALSKAAYPVGAATYTRDAMGRPTQIATPVGNRSYLYTAAGVPRSLSIGSMTSPLTVDPSDRLTSFPGQTFTFDKTGAIIATAGPAPASNSTQYSGLGGELVRRDIPSTPTTIQQTDLYSFDDVGRRTKETYTGWPTRDANIYGYNELNQLTSMSGHTRSGAIAPEKMTYGPTGFRFSTIRDGVRKLERWEEGLDGDAPPLLTQGLDSYVYGPGGMLLERLAGSPDVGNAEYQWQDSLGTVIGGTSETGVATPLTYDAWGHRTDVSETSPTKVGTIGFAGQEQEPGEDLVYMRARYYDPVARQFLTRDPRTETTLESYGYAAGNPTLNTDPTGLSAANDFANGFAQGVSGGLLRPGSARGSCSWAYFLGLQAGGALDPLQKAKKLEELAAASKGAYDALKAFKISPAQFGKKIGYHAAEFGIDVTSAAGRAKFFDIVHDIGSNPDQEVTGEFRGQGPGGSVGPVIFLIKGSDVVVTKLDGEFVTILKDGVHNNDRVKDALGR